MRAVDFREDLLREIKTIRLNPIIKIVLDNSQYEGVRIKIMYFIIVLHDLEMIIKTQKLQYMNEVRMSMLKSGRKWSIFGNDVRPCLIGWLISGLLYDHFKHGFKSIRSKGKKLEIKTFLTFMN